VKTRIIQQKIHQTENANVIVNVDVITK